MGTLIGALIGAAGSIGGSLIASHAQNKGAQTALTGYNYLKSNPLIGQLQAGGSTGEASALTSQDALMQLLGLAPAGAGANNAFHNYLNSTGYQFQLDQGDRAITGSAAAKGILNSGDTAKALTQYGQNLASTSFNNYLNQITGVRSGGLDLSKLGLAAADAVGQAGTVGGGNAGTLQGEAGQSLGTGVAQAANYLGGGLSSNPFGSVGGGSGELSGLF